MSGDGKIHIGTSGWHYKHWKGPFYPAHARAEELLALYAERFTTVEINNTFYRLPDEKTWEGWRKTVPPGFLFTVKASRFITHMKKLKDPEAPLAALLERACLLGAHLGPLLFQLPPGWRVNAGRLEAFLSSLPGGQRYAFEFRDATWFAGPVYEALERAGCAFCIYDLGGAQSPEVVTARFVYVRLHGPDGPYRGSYDDAALKRWAGLVRRWRAEGREVFVYFDNDEAGYAAADALRLKAMVEG